MTRIEIEQTDTFGGEANYSYCHRKEIILTESGELEPGMDEESTVMKESATDRQIVTKAKELLGFTGVKCDREGQGDDIALRPRGACQVIFIRTVY